MNLDLLKENIGNKVKYATLCEAFGVEKKTGKSKQLQIKDFERYAKLEKDGTWFTVVEVYDTPQEKINNKGKSEASLKALEQHRGHRQPDFKYDDELQLAILLYLVNRTNSENEEKQYRPNIKYPYIIGEKQLFTQTGLCDDFYKKVLSQDGYYLIGTREQIEKGEAMYTKQQYEEAFRDFYKHMQNDTRTALNDLRRRKVLEYIEIKSWYDGTEWHECNDMEMQMIVEAREDVIDWWNATHSKQLKETYDLYNSWTLTPKEKEEAFNYMNNRLKETISENYVSYTTSFKVYCSQRAIERHLTNIGCEHLMHDKKEMKRIIDNVSDKAMMLQLRRTLDKKREEHIRIRYEWEQQTHFGKVKLPYAPLADDETYNKARYLLDKAIYGANEKEYDEHTKIINKRKENK